MRNETDRIRIYRPPYFTIGSETADIILPQWEAGMIVNGNEVLIQRGGNEGIQINGSILQKENAFGKWRYSDTGECLAHSFGRWDLIRRGGCRSKNLSAPSKGQQIAV